MIACCVLSVGRMERRYEVTCEVECGGGEAIYIYIYIQSSLPFTIRRCWLHMAGRLDIDPTILPSRGDARDLPSQSSDLTEDDSIPGTLARSIGNGSTLCRL
jgi:hypothetical protein